MMLPGVLARIAEIAGEEAALLVAQAAGGTRKFIPARPTPGHWLVDAVGQDRALMICTTLVAAKQGDWFDIPLGPTGSRGRSWAALARANDMGMSLNEAARFAGVDRSTAKRHRRTRPKADPAQGDLPL